MPTDFTQKTWENPGTALNDLEARIAAGFAALRADLSALPAAKPTRTARVAVPALAANSITDVTVTWATPFADANYTIESTVEDDVSTAVTGSITRQIRSRTAAGCVVRISNGSPGQPDGQALLHVVAIHD